MSQTQAPTSLWSALIQSSRMAWQMFVEVGVHWVLARGVGGPPQCCLRAVLFCAIPSLPTQLFSPVRRVGAHLALQTAPDGFLDAVEVEGSGKG